MNKELRALIHSSAIFIFASTCHASTRIEEVVVTAQKRSEALSDVPIAITALTQEAIRNAGILSVKDVGAITPGLISTEGAGAFQPFIRGIGSRTVNPGMEAPTATYIDGVYMTDQMGLLLSGFSDVEGIEVLRGPQGTLYGRNATAGAISIRTSSPSQEFAARIEGTMGNEKQGASLFVTGGLSDSLSASISGFKEHDEGYIDNLYPANGAGNKVGEADNEGIRGKLLWEPAANLSFLFSQTHLNLLDRSKMAVSQVGGSTLSLAEGTALATNTAIPLTRGNKRSYAGGAEPESKYEFDGSALTIKWGGDAFDVMSVSSYGKSKSANVLDLDASPFDMIYIHPSWYTKTFQQDLTFTSNGDGFLSWVAGAYYFHQDAGYDPHETILNLPFRYSMADIAGSPTGQVVRQFTSVDIASKAIYGELNFNISPASTLTLGLRYTNEQHEIDSGNRSEALRSDGAGGVQAIATYAGDACSLNPQCHGLKTTFEEATWRVVFEHHLTDAIMTYASYNRGFKSGAYNISTATNVLPTDPEIVDAYELGLKGKFLDDSLLLNASVYYNDYSALQVQIVNPDNGAGSTVNAGKAAISGLELDAELNVTANFSVKAGFSTYFEAEYKEFDNCPALISREPGGTRTVAGDCNGADLPVTPDYTAYLMGNYIYRLQGGSELSLGGTFDYSDDYVFSPMPETPVVASQPIQKAQGNLNAYIAWTSPDQIYSVKLWGRNITDEDKLQGVYATGYGTDSQYARGRTYGVTVGASF